ncbi:mitochondrial 37S ribosomal protein uS7m [Lodderomyces beijingensis]|uniref:Small ribosomal subunit protein uS7 domain-containing protein n=1 Tax=Lodderomyces beijingensis TaxID=1775926 RepID=A0ABP0ZVB1_9ASCO
MSLIRTCLLRRQLLRCPRVINSPRLSHARVIRLNSTSASDPTPSQSEPTSSAQEQQKQSVPNSNAKESRLSSKSKLNSGGGSPQAGSLLAEIYPLNKQEITEQDLDKWIDAVKNLNGGKAKHETAEEIYLGQLIQPEPYLRRKFEPTREQLEETYAYANKQIPLRLDPTVQNFINLIMRHGRKAQARKYVSRAFYIVQMKLRKDPIEVLKETLDKLGPLVKTRTMSTGVAKKKVVPVPLNERQRNRYAITWILEASKNRKSNDFSVRLAEELINAYQGKSSGFEKKAQMHKQATQQRAYIQL